MRQGFIAVLSCGRSIVIAWRKRLMPPPLRLEGRLGEWSGRTSYN